ncbi:hypothetical protein LEP1GSC081_4124 [Leptospira kirschneri str. H1]|uniref:Uncharacterized protein n=1 Tax=Leptospira kirschneri str. H1 TaxID=1049966 RepID=A0A0E2B5P4_9LEPT|nr:hypothetical protein LEP1GSC081_4124 [Leptospira kirschneri str. H1]
MFLEVFQVRRDQRTEDGGQRTVSGKAAGLSYRKARGDVHHNF